MLQDKLTSERPPRLRLVWLLACLGLAAVVGVLIPVSAGAAILVYPSLLFAYRLDEGRLTIVSDRPLAENPCRRMLADVDARVRQSQLDNREGRHWIVVANVPWRRRATFLWAYGAGGVNFYPFTRNVFLSGGSGECNHLISPFGTPVPPPRTLAYFAAHEIAHSLTGEAVGPLAFHRLPVWIREGLADHIALPQRGDFADLADAFQRGTRDLDPRQSGLYTRYRLLVLYLLEREGWSERELLASNLSQADAEKRLLQYLAQGQGSMEP